MSVILILLILLGVIWLAQAAIHNGVSKADRKLVLPGDEILARPGHTIDRATLINAPAAEVWPWLVQLGKGRAGWYAPSWIEWFMPSSKQGAHKIVPKLQKVRVGDVHPDWGPASLQVLEIKKNKYIVYGSVRDKAEVLQQSTYLFSWALILMPINAEQCRLYVRLRFRRPKHAILAYVLYILGGLFDYLTIIVLFSGLKQRLHLKQDLRQDR
jgi:hypothetical protein